MSPIWQSIVLLSLSAIVIPSITWIIAKIIEYGKDLTAIKVELESLKAIQDQHRNWLLESSRSLDRVDKNVVAIAAKLNVLIQN